MSETLIQRYFDYVYRDDLKSERFLKCTPEEQERLRSVGMEKSREYVTKLLERINARDLKLYFTAWFHPTNKYNRWLFTEVTGIDLPPGATATAETVKQWVGVDRLAAHDAEQQAAQRLIAENAARQEKERLDALVQKIKENCTVGGGELAEAAKHVGIVVPPQTIGMLRRRVYSLNDHSASVRGGSCGNSPFNLYKQVREVAS